MYNFFCFCFISELKKKSKFQFFSKTMQGIESELFPVKLSEKTDVDVIFN